MVSRILGIFLVTLAVLAATITFSTNPATASVIAVEKAPPAPVLSPDFDNYATAGIVWYCQDRRAGDKDVTYTVRIFCRNGAAPATVGQGGKNEPWYWSKVLLTKRFYMVKEFVLSGDKLPTKGKPASFEVKLPDMDVGAITYAVTVSRLCEVNTPRRSVRMRESRPGFYTIEVAP